MRSSLRWALIGWFGLLLAAVLLAFGGALYWQTRRSTIEGIDAGLQSRVRALAGALEFDAQDGWELELSDDYLRAVAEDTYFRIQTSEGRVLRQAGSVPDRASGAPAGHDVRELELESRDGVTILVGRSIAAERARLATLLATLIGSGTGVLAVALCVGLWLARRTLRPVDEMTKTAAALNEHDLSGRLDEQRCPEELRGLARAFNESLVRLEAAFERQARFTADAAHELRTPVAVVRAQVEQALKHERSGSEYRETLRACLRASERMTHLVAGLMTLTRLDAAEAGTVRLPIRLDELVRSSVELLQPSAAAEEVALHCRTEPATIQGDPGLLAAMLTNLVSNALRYNRRGGAVDVSLARQNGHVVLDVRDTGIGIPADALPHLFERFFRVDPARSSARGGTGLGLAITRGIVAAHGGSIEVASTPGQGSTFTIHLPADGS